MKTIAVSELRANLMKVLKKTEHGSTINITSRGRVVAKLVPPEYSSDKAKEKLNEISKNAILNDVISPIDSEWESSN